MGGGGGTCWPLAFILSVIQLLIVKLSTSMCVNLVFLLTQHGEAGRGGGRNTHPPHQHQHQHPLMEDAGSETSRELSV